MGKNFKVGDPVRTNVKHLSTFGKSGMVTSTDENFVYVEFENLLGTYTFQSESLELIQEEPMAQFMIGDHVQSTRPPRSAGHIRAMVESDVSRWIYAVDIGDTLDYYPESDLELIQEEPDIAAFNAEQEYRESIQEEPMAHPYLTPEKIEQLADAINGALGPENPRDFYLLIKSVLEREANPPPKPKVFTVTIPARIPGPTSEEIVEYLTGKDHFVGATITVEEVPS